VDERLCLRCDWTGETERDGCPRCGAALYRLGHPSEVPSPQGAPIPLPETERSRERSPAAEDAEEVEEHDRSPAHGGRARVIVLALTLVAASFGFAWLRAGDADPANGSAGAADAQPQMPSTGLFSPGSRSSSPPPQVGCTQAPRPRVLTPAETVPAPTADYRFQGSLASSAGTGPNLIEIGREETAYTDEETIGRTVLTFAERTGLSLAQTRGVVPRDEYTIEILLRLDDVSGYRKLVDLKNGSRDGGLYVQDGCLTFFPKTNRPSTSIEPDTYVQVVLTRGASDAVVGYVDGISQLVFDDQLGIGEIGRSHVLRFFIDDSRTKVEHSSGAVSQIRLYDRALTADEVAALVCSEIRVPLDETTSMCPSP